MICTNDECRDWTVLEIRGEYRQGITECPRCSALLVEQLAEAARTFGREGQLLVDEADAQRTLAIMEDDQSDAG